MTDIDNREHAVREFAAEWKDKGDEKQHSQKFWIDLLEKVVGAVNATKVIDFEERVKIGSTKYIDGYIAETKTIIEQKGAKIDLDRAETQSDGTELTPFEQAKRYNDNLPYEKKARWIVVSNFQEFRIHDMNKVEPAKDFTTIKLTELDKQYQAFNFLVDEKIERIRIEEDLSVKSSKYVKKLVAALKPQYIDINDSSSARSLNILCVRIVFCLYAEKAGLFASRTAFEDYIKSFAVENLRDGLIKLFKALDTPEEKRSKYDTKTAAFPYVNGGLFHDESIEIPNLTKEFVEVIEECERFRWNEISPTIFGAVFESTLSGEIRHSGGMHYTSIENIHKVIDPLFLDDLKAELAEITGITSLKERRDKIAAFQDKIAGLQFLDPACGSGNFLTESYLSLAKLEIAALEATKDAGEMFVSGQPKVDISQFYGIEINDFAVTVAKTALWIAESQVNSLVNAILQEKRAFLPLKTSANIVEGNALRMDWATLQDLTPRPPLLAGEGELSLFEGFYTKVDGTAHKYDYIMGNPPFVGSKYSSESQKADMDFVFKGATIKYRALDYVSCWYKMALDLIKGTSAKCALVSTNSITQGEQVSLMWKPLFENGLQIDFAYRTFRWDSESTEKAHVHCVIVGFSHLTPRPPLLEGEGEAQVFTSRNIKGDVSSAQNLPSPARRGAGGEVIRHQKVSKEKLELARKFRKEPTESENAVWQMLRNRQIKGLKWRRQQVIDGFIADFYCAELKAVLEIDGSVHNTQAAQDYDEARTEIFSYHGIKTYRLKNDDCNANKLTALVESMIANNLPSLARRGAGGEVTTAQDTQSYTIQGKPSYTISGSPSHTTQDTQSYTIQDKPSYTISDSPSYTAQDTHSHTISGKHSYTTTKKIYNADGTIEQAENINGYLLDAPNVFIESRSKPICNVPPLLTGSQRIDDDNFMFDDVSKEEFLKKEPQAEKYFRVWYGADEFLNNRPRWCLYLGNCSPAELKKMPNCKAIIEKVREYRLASKRSATVKAADYPAHFGLEVIPESNFMIVPVVSSEKRRYVPLGFMSPEKLCSNQVNLIPNATLYHFGVLTSSVHMAWMRAVCGRLEMRYRYSKDIVYNNFPFVLPHPPTPSPSKRGGGSDAQELPSPKWRGGDSDTQNLPSPLRRGVGGEVFCTQEQGAKIEHTAQAILEARAKYPDSSLADLYDETLMPADLRKAHRANDRAVMAAYGFDAKMSEADIVAALFKLYEELTAKAK